MDELKGARPQKTTRTHDYAIRFICYLLIFSPAALALLYVRAFGVSVVFMDAWSMVPLLDKWSSGTLRLSDLWAQHNEHRMFFPKGIELLLGTLTQYDNVPEMYLILACFLITLITLLLAFKRSIEPLLFKSYSILLLFPVSLLIFSFRQHENMLFGFQINFAFAVTFGVLALFLLYAMGHIRFEKSAFIASLGSATVASFSVALGLFVWPAGLLQLFIRPLQKPKKWGFITLWSLAGLVVWVGYFVNYVKPKNSQPLLYTFEQPVQGMSYFVNLLGSSLFWDQKLASLGGVLITCLALFSLLLTLKDRRLPECSFWVSLLFYAFLILVSITLGRASLGVGQDLIGQALVSRYTSFSILVVVCIYAMLVATTLQRRSSSHTLLNPRTILLIALSATVLLSSAFCYSKGIDVGNQVKLSREKAAFALYTYESQPDEFLAKSLLSPGVKAVRNGAPTLQRLGYNVFSERQAPNLPPPLSTLSPISSSTSSGIDALYTDTTSGAKMSQENRSVVIPKEASFIWLSGWAVDAINKSAAGGVYVDIDGKLFPAFYGTDRQDVAGQFGVRSYRYSGFERAMPVPEISAGSHELSVIVLTSDKKGYYQPTQKVFLEIR